MRDFNKLVLNEWLKMSKKRSFFIPYAIIAIVSVALVFILNKWAHGMIESGFAYTEMMVGVGIFGQMLALLAIICTAGTVAHEHTQGTIKFLLIRGQSRSRILASKLVAVSLFTLSLIVFTELISMIAGGMVLGFHQEPHAWSNILLSGLYTFIYSMVYIMFTFMVGVLTRSTGAAMGIGMFAIFVSKIMIPKAFYKYILFPNADLSIYSHGGQPPIDGMTLTFSIVMLALYSVLFLGASFVTFKKRDIA